MHATPLFFDKQHTNSEDALIWKTFTACITQCTSDNLALKGPFPTLIQRAPWPNFLWHEFTDHCKPSKIVFLKSHPGLIVHFFTVNTFSICHFTVSLLHFEFCPEESREKIFFKCHAWISSYSENRVGKKDNIQIFSLSRSSWGF